MNNKILPENFTKLESEIRDENILFENMDIFKSRKKELQFFSAITLPLILAIGPSHEPIPK